MARGKGFSFRRWLFGPLLYEMESRVYERLATIIPKINPGAEAEARMVKAVLEQTNQTADSLISLIALLGRPYWELPQEIQWMLSSGANFAEARMARYIPIRIYLKHGEDFRYQDVQAANAVMEILRSRLEADFILSVEMEVETGSVWKRFWMRTREKLTKHDVEEKVAKAFELDRLDKPQAETSKLQAEATATILKELATIDNACIQVGSTLVAKRTTNGKAEIAVRTLTPLQLKRLEEDQTILLDPQKVFALLGGPRS